MNELIYSTLRERYSIDQVRSTITVGDLIAFLQGFDDDTLVYLNFDNGYTYGAVNKQRFEESYDKEYAQ
jgi:hypothetical protein